MFAALAKAPPDPILGLTDAFKADPRADKVNLGVGIYKDDHGDTPLLRVVQEAERRLAAEHPARVYLGIAGDTVYGRHVRALLLGASDPRVDDGRADTAQTPGGTGALRVAADFLHQQAPHAAIWMPDPTWENHHKVFEAAGLVVKTYPYYDVATGGLAFARTEDALGNIPRTDVVLLHGSCHNPTGVDPSHDQWTRLAAVAQQAQWLPLFDVAYQGLGDGLDEDVFGVRTFAARVPELLVCSSFSKSFGLYAERCGALTLVGANQDAVVRAFSQVKIAIRTNYSNPPFHGAAVVARVLSDDALRRDWLTELDEMRARIHEMRRALVAGLQSRGVARDFSFLLAQKGMFSYTGLSPADVDRLREQHGIYIVRSGRINVAGITTGNLPRLVDGIAAVLG